MAGDGIQNYVDLAAGLTKATRAKATAAAKGLLATAGLEEVAADATDRVAKLTDEVLAASRANRELMGKLIASEVDRAAAVLGFVRAEELDDLRRELSELRMSMAHAAAQTDQTDVTEPITEPWVDPMVPSPAKKTAGKKTAAKKTAVKKTPAKKLSASSPPAKSVPAKKATAKKATAKQATASHGQAATAKKAPAKQAPAKPAPAKKAPVADPGAEL